jgi:hypothetical protein
MYCMYVYCIDLCMAYVAYVLYLPVYVNSAFPLGLDNCQHRYISPRALTIQPVFKRTKFSPKGPK